MTDYIFSCGNGDISSDSKSYTTVQTSQAKNICIGLEKSGVPYSANFTDQELKLTYDADYQDSVEEIIQKAQTDDYDEMLREIKEYKDDCGYLILLSTVAYYLNMTEGALKRRPEEQQNILCKLFVDLWFADTPTIQCELSKAMVANRETERDLEQSKQQKEQEMKLQEQPKHDNAFITREMLLRQAEIIKRKQAVKQKQLAEINERERNNRP